MADPISNSQSSPQSSDTLESQCVDFMGILQNQVELAPKRGSQGYISPSAEQLSDWQTLIQSTKAVGSELNVEILKKFPSYRISEITDCKSEQKYRILSESSGTSRLGWGTYVVNLEPQNEDIITINHPLYDINSWRIGGEVFLRTDSKYLLMAGTHRYANSQESESDTARNDNSPFQKAYETLLSSAARTISIHGYTKSNYEGAIAESDVVMSAGTDSVPGWIACMASDLSRQQLSVGVYDGSSTFRELKGSVNPQMHTAHAISGLESYVQIEVEKEFRNNDTYMDFSVMLASAKDSCTQLK